jgi:hypothetical protein
MKNINWLNVAKLVAAFALALGAHFVTPDATTQAIDMTSSSKSSVLLHPAVSGSKMIRRRVRVA